MNASTPLATARFSRRRLLMAATAAPLVGFPAISRAQARRLTIVLTVPPGTSSDVLARLLGEQVRAKLDRNVIVEPKPGGGGAVAVQHLRSFEADGSAVLVAPSSAMSLLPMFTKKPPFDVDKDVVPVVNLAAAPHGITVNTSMGVNSFADYIEQVRRNPKLGSIGTPSPAGLASLLVYQIRKTIGVDVQHVPYKGGSPLLADLLGGQIPASASIMPDYLADHRAGKLRILAISSEARSPLAPDIPTFTELGHAGFVAVTSFGLFAKSGTPPAVVNEFAAAFSEALAAPAVVQRLHQMGLEPQGGQPADYRNRLAAERTRWTPLIRETGMTID
ncbi:tripartite tricarboxylate transporter substrate-binding protein [Ramlibacter sp.]|uniref:tripartite tricarboxylate transporter substrate-binding protein n=1 Tax=Ramlibacter sp. TaxID=1917967 RepID=UPI0035B31CA9